MFLVAFVVQLVNTFKSNFTVVKTRAYVLGFVSSSGQRFDLPV
jgi:hypothetical protein